MVSGLRGVPLFFLLSGFILGHNYLHKVVERRDFYLARFARVYPLYLLGVLLGVPLMLLVRKLPLSECAVETARQLVLLQSWSPVHALEGNGVGWTLSVEALFYATFPFFVGRVTRMSPRQALALLLVAVAVAILPQVLYHLSPGYADDVSVADPKSYYFRFFPIFHLPEFVSGVALAQFTRGTAIPKPNPSDVWTVGGLVAFVLLTLSPMRLPSNLALTGGLTLPFDAVLYGLSGEGKFAALLSLPVLGLLGESSYALYVTHVVLWRLVDRAGLMPTQHSVFVGTLLTIFASVMLFRFVETPARRAILARFGRRRHVAIGSEWSQPSTSDGIKSI